MRWLLKGGEVLDPGAGLTGRLDVLIEDDRILDIGSDLRPSDDTGVEDVSGCLVMPGAIDMHVHLRQPGQDDKETIRTGGRSAVQGGVTAVACMPNTSPPVDNEATVAFVLRKAREASPAEVFPIACVTIGQKGTQLSEMWTLRQAGVVGFSDDGKPVASAEIMRRALEYSRMLGCAVMDHCEEPTMTQGACMNEGYTSTVLGLRGMPSVAEEIMVARDCMLAEMTGGHAHICHVSTARSVDLVRQAKARGAMVTAEVTIHHLLLNDDLIRSFDTHCKVNPPLRTDADLEACLAGLVDGTIDCLVSDHAPHTREDKEVEFDHAPFGISGVQTLVPLTFSELVRKGHLSAPAAVQALTASPARILALPDGYGSLRKGSVANVTVLDLKRPLVVDMNGYETKGKNAPYQGMALMGSSTLTVVRGRVVARDGVVIEPWTPIALETTRR
ncbi:MAG TPA: dihydroorotase [Candidatus Xenobia bacterium]|jgi:dihydroorotase